MSNFQSKSLSFRLSSKIFQYLFFACSLQLIACSFLNAQDNSPYSRYGLGDLQPSSHIYNRGMGGITAAFSEPPSTGLSDPRNGRAYSNINFTNPASYSRFFAIKELNTKKLQYGRMLLDVGVNLTSHRLREPNKPGTFTSTNAYFSYMQVGIPLKKNWGMVLGIRPLSTIGYRIDKNERLYDPNTGLQIDSARTQFRGDGGTFLLNTGTGFAIGNFSLGVNLGYLFGKKNFDTRRVLINDTVSYSASNHQSRSNFGGVFFNGGMQYRIDLSPNKLRYLQLGAYGSMERTFKTHTDYIRETWILVPSDASEIRLDSVYQQNDVKGEMVYPATFGAGFIFEQLPDVKKSGWLIGVDISNTNWDNYSYNGQKDAVKSSRQIRVGGQMRPRLKDTYKSLLAYRAGTFFGDDYVYINNQKLQVWGITGGISLPIANLKDASRRFRNQYSVVNISAEYIKRGNNANPINENMFRLSFGFTLSDLWFVKHKYE